MHGFEWKDQRGVEGTGFVRALRCLMTSQLPNLLPSLRCTLENEMMAELKQCRTVKGAKHLKVFPSIKRVVARTNSLFFFGNEYIEPLRRELEDNSNSAAVLDQDAFPLLDSFLKESSRLSISDAISVRRKALKDLDCFNGTHVNEGDWVCVAQRAIMHDSDHYSDPEAFDAFRFARTRPNGQNQESSRFTDAKPDWLIWGYGKTTCPGRFYASAVLRLLLCHVLENFDVQLLDQTAKRAMTWRSAIIPCSSTTIVVRPRVKETINPAAMPSLTATSQHL
ncbi:MAG: hypothetical protein Q9169_006680 [Polycauliona sp. 2 TL-2023]